MKTSTRKKAASEAPNPVRDADRPPPNQRPVSAVPPTVPSRRLDVFPNPTRERDYTIQFVIPEFTCHCPLTGQPDFAHFTIRYVPDQLCVELKSLKLYMWSYRNEGAFHEAVTNRIRDDLVSALKPRKLLVEGDFNTRGGIRTVVRVEYSAPGR